MNPEAFAAQRREILRDADDRIRPAAQHALVRYSNGETRWWGNIVAAAAQVWLENYQAESPGTPYQAALNRFRESLGESLAETKKPEGAVTIGQVERVTRWAATLSVNSGTISGAFQAGVKHKMWVDMDDSKVRPAHAAMDGQVVPIGSTFDVAGHKLPYPGAPVGPPDVWIECRCVARPAARRGEVATSTTFSLDPEESENKVRGHDSFAALANPDGTPYTGALVVLIPASDDPIVAASSEPAHVTTIWFGELDDLPVDVEELEQAVRFYAQDLDGPLVVPTGERGTLGDDDADVQHLEKTDSLVALRDGLLANEPIKTAFDAADQFPEWNPHVTLGYPERPALAEYDATEVTFDRIALWLGGEHFDYPMGGTVAPDKVTADASQNPVDDQSDLTEAPTEVAPAVEDEDVDGPFEIPIHGVDAIEKKSTGDGRHFQEGAVEYTPMPQPLGFEFETSHGGDNSRVSIVGRIDEVWFKDFGEYIERRFRGAIQPDKPYAAQALEGIIDGSYGGISVILDSASVDVEASNAAFDAAAEGTTPVTFYSNARVRRRDMVPTPAFYEAYVAIGGAFEDEITDEERDALAACGCSEVDYSLAPGVEDLTADVVVVEKTDAKGTATFGPFETRDEAEAWVAQAGDGEYDFVSVNRAVMASAGIAFAPGTKDGPGWITNPRATSRIRKYWTEGEGAAKIAWGTPGDFNRCRALLAKYVQNPDWLAGLCANMHYEVLKTWPGPKRGDKGHGLAASAGAPPYAPMRIAASAESFQVFDSNLFREPDEDRAFGMRIDRETRRVWGYAAEWGSCHIGISGMCQEAPHSQSDYSYFRKGVVDTDAGEQRVALLTMGIGHADEYMSAAAATLHYDQTDAVKAYINIGENHRGIWYSGVLPDYVTEADIQAMRAIGRVSGDWRNWSGRRGDLEMIGLVVVNTEGFQLAASGGIQSAVVGSIGAPPIEDEVIIADAGMTHEQFVDSVAEKVALKFREEQARENRVIAARAATQALRVADARRRIERIRDVQLR